MIICEGPQGTDQWKKDRLGIPTSSDFDKIVTSSGSPSKQRTSYLDQKAAERGSGIIEETYQNANMVRGKEMEAEAREAYSFITHSTVKQVGFCKTEGKFVYGASPDGTVGSKGLLELKCPKGSTHVAYLRANELPIDYFQQTQGQLLVTGRSWVDFVSYYPGLKPLIVRVQRDKKFLVKMEHELNKFCIELDQLSRKIKGGSK